MLYSQNEERYSENEERLNDILDMIGSMASLDFSKVLQTSHRNDMVDAIALGLNMLSEELNTQVVTRRQLDEINEKLEKFAFTTAHDLKSPLNAMTGLLHLLEYSLAPDSKSEVIEYMSRLKKMTEKMKGLISGILEYSRTFSLEMKTEIVDLNQLLNDVIENDNVADRANIDVDGKLPEVLFNKTAGVQVIRNLLDNAIKYSDKRQCEIKISTEELDDHYQITFSDNGPGIAAEHHETIFELYNQVDTGMKEDSLGIGLATVKNIITSAGGRIWLESVPGEGASFIFTLKKT
ncbi:sensory transduction histidine kinase [Fulvivirga imtechensis AK7]|uniref:histidine kinase n=1 Tax=Fulvivirga imtechensis AK7 TaxID=1237149 RepID=L8JX17_9BACT|nr:HAMP domain-containing sensor histidine kinase [Fulvivirga imtechensis]ELR73325.1 sensory transduction histidine kinase [Fulvivirga imtechensis AK7]